MQAISSFLPYFQIILSVILCFLVLVQQSEGALGSAFGGGELGGNFRTRRGAELFIFRSTIAVSVLFILSALANLIL